MATPAPDAAFPFGAAPLPISALCAGGTDGRLSADARAALVRQAFALLRASHAWSKGKVVKTDVADVQVFKGASVHTGRLAKCAWHGRHSVHPPAQTKGNLTWDDFRAGLFVNHPQQETEYIEEMTSAVEVDVLERGVAEVWNNTYALPSLTANRDFLQLLLTLELPPHAEPYSAAHEAQLMASLAGETLPEPGPDALRSFIVIQLPVSHDKCPERGAEGYVRAYYASVEAIHERADKTTEWRMFLQSDASGRVPLFFQEMAMPSKTAPDVPCYIHWKVKKNEAAGREPTATTTAPVAAAS